MSLGVVLNTIAITIVLITLYAQRDINARLGRTVATQESRLQALERRTLAPPVCLMDGTQDMTACYSPLDEALRRGIPFSTGDKEPRE